MRCLIDGASQVDSLAWIDRWTEQNPAFNFVPYRGHATAYVVDTVQTVLHFYSRHSDFEEALIATVNQGDDADTTGALIGMLAGARCGAAALPRRWLQRLQPQTVRDITDQCSGLLALSHGLPEAAHG